MSQKRKAVIPISSRRRKIPRIDAMQAVLDDRSVLENIFSRVAPGDVANVSGVSKTWGSIILGTYGAAGLLMSIMKSATKDGQQMGYFRKYIKSVTEPNALVDLAEFACSNGYIVYLKAIMAQFVPLYGGSPTSKTTKFYLESLWNLESSSDRICDGYLHRLELEARKFIGPEGLSWP